MRKFALPVAAVLLIVAALLFVFFRSGTTGILPYVMPAEVSESTGDLLQQLDGSLMRHTPELYEALNPGISQEELNQLELGYGHELHPDVRALYRWHNGLSGELEFFRGHEYYSFEDAVRLNREINVSPFGFLLAGEKNWLILFPDPAGDGYYYDPTHPYRAGGVFYVFREDGYYRYFPSLKNLLKAILEMYEADLLPYEMQSSDIAFEDQWEQEQEILDRYSVVPPR